MNDTTMTTKLRQAQAAMLAMAAKLGIDSMENHLSIMLHEEKWYVTHRDTHGLLESSHEGDTLEQAYLKALDEEIPF